MAKRWRVVLVVSIIAGIAGTTLAIDNRHLAYYCDARTPATEVSFLLRYPVGG